MEDKLDSYFVSLSHESFGLSLLEGEIMSVGIEADTDTFDVNFLLFGLGLLFFLGLLIDEFAVISDFADRRLGQGRYLDEVRISFESKGDSDIKRHDAMIFACFVNNDDFSRENLLIDAQGILWTDLWFGSIVPSSSHVNGIKNKTVELMGIAPMSSHIPSK